MPVDPPAPPHPAEIVRDDRSPAHEFAPMHADAQIASLERVIKSLKDELTSERKRHADAAEEAETHKSWATELFAELSVLKRRLEEEPDADPPAAATAVADNDADAPVESSNLPVAGPRGFVDRLRPLAARAPARFGAAAAVAGAFVAAVAMSLAHPGRDAAPSPTASVVPIAAPEVRAPNVPPPPTHEPAPAKPIEEVETADASNTPVRVDDVANEPVRMSIDIGGARTATNAEKPDAKAKPAFDRVATAGAVRQAFEAEGLAGVDVRVSAVGRVSLGGAVDAESQKERAATIARAQTGVREVANGITVRSAATPEGGAPKLARDTTSARPVQVATARNLQGECEAGTNLLNRTMKAYLCMKKQCRTPELASHPQCVEFCERDRSAC